MSDSDIPSDGSQVTRRDFLELTWREQDDLLKTIRDGKPAAALDLWQRMPVHRFWTADQFFQKAKAVIVSGYAIETPRLLLNSTCSRHENGLANSSDTVGRYLMAQAGNVILERFAEPVRMYKAPPAHALTEDFYETDKKRNFARGFVIQTVDPLPIAFAKQMVATKGAWGWGMRRA